MAIAGLDLAPDALAGTARTEIVFIEDNVADYQTIAREAGAGREIVILDSHADGLQQILSALAGRTGIDALHIVSHGAAGTLNLGTLTLDDAGLSTHAAQLQAIGQSMTPDGDILLYGCDIGAGGSGFIDQLASATGADVAASSNLTGSALLGGDWKLEVASGTIEVASIGGAGLSAAYGETLALTLPYKVDFEQLGAVSGNYSPDVYYTLNGDAAYRLHIHADGSASVDWGGNGSYTAYASTSNSNVDISFENGQTFSIASLDVLQVSLYQAGTVTFTGLDSNKQPITASLPWTMQGGNPKMDLSGFNNISYLRISAQGGSGMDVEFDNLQLINSQPVDTTPPTMAITSDRTTLVAGQTAQITFTFSEDPGLTFTNADVTVSGGALGALVGTGLVRTATFTPTANTNNGTGNISVAAGSYADAAGNANTAASNAAAISYDTKAPTVTVSSNQPSLKAGESAIITFTFSEDPGSSFNAGALTVSGGTLGPITGSSGMTRTATFTPTANTDNGTATIAVKNASFQDAAGNSNTGSSSLSFGYDSLAPSTPGAPVLASGDDSGTSNSDGITSRNPLIVSGTADNGSTVKLYDGATEIASVTVSGGTYTFSLSNLAEGNHTLAAVAVDAAGNWSAASAGQVVIVDRTAPATSVVSAMLSNDTGSSATDMITKIASQTISGTLGANLQADERVMVSLDNGATWNAATASTGSNTWSLNATLGGSGTLKVQVVDLAGNVGPVYAHAYTLDTAAPAAPSTPDLDTGSDSGSSSTDNITGATLPSFSGTAEVGATVRLFDGGIEIGSDVVGGDGKWHITTGSGTPFNQRTHFVTAIATDVAGNSSINSPALEVQVITSGPATTIAGMALSMDSGVAGDFITNTAAQTISGTLSGNLVAGERVQVSLDGGHAWLDAASATGSNAWSIAATLAAGSHDIQVRVIDAVDNAGPIHIQAYTLDSVGPTVAITSSASTLKAGETATITFTFSEDPGSSFGWDGSAGDLTVSGGSLSAISGTGTTRTATFTPSANTDAGTASITIAAGQYHDAAGNAGAAGAMPTIAYDTLAPNVPGAPALASGDDSGASSSDKLTNKSLLTFTSSAVDGTTVRLYDGGVEIGHVTASGGKYSIPVNNLGEGAHSLTAIAFDAAGNASAASGALAVTVDRTPPTTMAASVGLSNDTGASSSDMITADANQTISGTLSASLAAGEQVMVSLDNGASWNVATASVGSNAWSLPATLVGSGTLKVQVVDLAGNVGPVYAQAYTLDTTAPAAPSTPDLDTGSDSGSSSTDNITGVTKPAFSGSAELGSTVRLYDGATEIGHTTVTDGSWHITSDIALADGSHSITAKATDLAGNVSDASAALTVQILTAGPSTTVQGMALSNDTGAAGDFITNKNAQTISGTLSANLAAGERVQVSLDGGNAWHAAASATGGNAWSIAATLAAGSHDIQVRVIDALDNAGPIHIQAYTLDSAGPTVVITSDQASLKAGETATITFTFSEDPGSSFGWDGSAGDLTVSGGSLSAISGTGLVRTAIFTPDANVNGGSAGIGIKANFYEDAAGNPGSAATAPALAFDTLAPGAPTAPALDRDSDKGASDSDNLTSAASLVFKGTAEAGATVTLYDSDGSTVIGSGIATGGNWTITTSALGEGSHAVTARASDAAGNLGAMSGATTVTIDSTRPTLLITSNASQLKVGETATFTFTFSEDPGSSFGWDGSSGSLTVSGGTLSAMSGSGLVRTAIFTPAPNTDAGSAGIIVNDGAYRDAAGNDGAAAVAPSLRFDTLAPAAPAAPALQAASDTGVKGDGLTQASMPVIEGTALANAVVTLYETIGTGRVKIGTALADGSGKWSIATGLSIGVHTLSATQSDAAGNESAASTAFMLRIDEPPMPVSLIDGMAVTIQPISLPGGVNGSAVSIPIVGTDRVESSGSTGVADIPLASSGQGGALLLAQVAPGYGLSASGANLPVAGAGELLLAAIRAATPTHAASDQGHLTGNGQGFLAGLASGGSLLVETVKPVSATVPNGVLTLSGQAVGTGQSTALVIDAGGLAAGSTIALQQVNFAAVIGAANVTAQGGMVLSGDAAVQHFTVAPGGAALVFAGGGKDVLSVGAADQGSSPAAGVTLLHGGSDTDAASFGGARADYDIAFHNGYAIVSSKAAPGVKAMVVNVEQLQFSDTSVTVQNSTDMDLLAGMYQTVLGRQADVMGIEYWANVHQAGASWGSVALSMIASSEHAAGHVGFNGVAAHDIALLYTAIFNRDADASGLAYWSAAMANGTTLEQVASSFVQSVEMVGHQRAAADWDFSVA